MRLTKLLPIGGTFFLAALAGTAGALVLPGCIDPALECGDQTACPSATAVDAVCVDTQSDFDSCGACGVQCEQGEICQAGGCVPGCATAACAYDVVAVCGTTGQVVALQSGTGFRGPRRAIGANPQRVAAYQDMLLVADLDERLYQAGAEDLLARAASALIGKGANHLLVDDPYVYVNNSETGTLQILLANGGTAEEGYLFETVREVPYTAGVAGNTWAQSMARLGDHLYVTLAGGFGDAAAAEGQRVLKIDVSAPGSAAVVGEIDLRGLDLQPFEGGAPVPRPAEIVVHRGLLYVALQNHYSDYSVAGPAMLARIDPSDDSVDTVNLGSDVCLQATSLLSAGDSLFVGCLGRAVFDENWSLLSVEKTGVVVLDGSDGREASWSMDCGEQTAGCAVPQLNRMALIGDQLFVGDQNGGRVFVLAHQGGALTERLGYGTGASGRPIQACSPGVAFSAVSDLVALP